MSLLDRTVSLALPAIPKPIVRAFSKRYIAGPTLADALRAVRDLRRQGAMATLDILGEFIKTPEEARANARSYEELLTRATEEGLETHVSVKLSAMGLLLSRELCLDLMRPLVGRAKAIGSFVRLDMEDSSCTTATLEVHETLRAEYPRHVGIVLQARLRRTQDDVERLGREANVRLCKGIYLEPRSISWTDPEIIRRSFVAALERLFEQGAYVGVATHDELLVWEALRLVRRFGLSRDQYEFQMLLGVEEALRRILIDAGHRLRVYVPYGEHWYQYSVRRLRENPQIAGYALRAILQRTPIP